MPDQTRATDTSTAAHVCQSDPCSVCGRSTSGPAWATSVSDPEPAPGANYGWSLYPCWGGFHDFAVGPTHAICNRCEKVKRFPVTEVEADRPES